MHVTALIAGIVFVAFGIMLAGRGRSAVFGANDANATETSGWLIAGTILIAAGIS
jgi:hypothetical protein